MNISQEKIYLKDYKEFQFEISNIELEFNLDPSKTLVKAIAKYQLKQGYTTDTELELNGELLDIQSIKIDNNLLSSNEYSYNDGILKLNANKQEFTLETEVIINPAANKALSGLYMSGGRFCTQCESEGFRRITFWPDRPDVMSIYKVKIIANKDEYPTLLANGNCIETGTIDDKHFAIWEDPWRKPSYLFAMVAGKLDILTDSFVTMENRNVALNIYVDEGASQKAIYAMDSLKRAMKWDEETYGLAYDLDIFNIVAVRDFNFGAMENKGLNIFNSSLLLADSHSATDFDFGRIEGVVAHEYFHNWSGNRVTCRDWFQLSLKEGLTVFRDQEFSADMRSRSVQRIQDVIALRARQFAEDSGPNAHPVRPQSYASIDNFYTSTIYEKGAEIIRVAKNIIGEKAYFEGAKNYFKTNDGTAATIEDWLKALRTQDTGNQLFGIEKWYAQAGTPNVYIETSYENSEFKIKLRQNTPDTNGQTNKEWVPIPFKLALFSQSGDKLSFNYNGETFDELNYIFASETAEIILSNVASNPILSPLRDFSAPVKIIYDQAIDSLAILAEHDDNAFVKWESLQTIAKKCLVLLYNNIKDEEGLAIVAKLTKIFANTIENAENDYAYAALLLGIPTFNDLIQEIKDAVPEQLLAARSLVLTKIYVANLVLLEKTIRSYNFNEEFKTDAKSAGKRSFMNMVLFIYSYGDDEDNNKLIYECFKHANNLSDKMAAFTALNRFGAFYFHKAILDFETEYSNNPLVMDKWFAVQSNSLNENIVGLLEKLSTHKDFDITNPNRARSIYSSFALNNPIFFNSKDGKGYEFIINAIEKIDKINNSVAARLATCFERLTQIEPKRRSLAKELLIKLSKQDISKQLNEILTPIIGNL